MELACEILDSIHQARVLSLLAFLVPLDPEPDVISCFRVVKKSPCVADGAILRAEKNSLT
jgi:hypothetical protein